MDTLRGSGIRVQRTPVDYIDLGRVFGKKKGLDPSVPGDAEQLKAVAQGYQTGAYNDEQIQQFIQENPATEIFLAPVLAQTRARRSEAQQYFSPGRSLIEQPDVIERAKAGEPVAPTQPRADFTGALTSALHRGDVDFATKLHGLAPKPETKESPFAKVNPKDYTPESIRRFEQSGGKDYSLLTPYDPDKATKEGDKLFNWEKKLRDEYRGLSKPFIDVRDSYGRIQESAKNPSAAGDLSMIFNYMKMLDPESVVRESEFATAAASGSYGARIQGLVNRALSGERLADSVRQDFIKRAEALYKRQLATQKKNEAQYRSLAKKYGVKDDRVVTDFDLEAMKEAQETKVIGGKTYVKINGEWFEQ